MSYSEKLRDPRWQKKRLKILERDNFKCQLCGDTKTELQVHHLKYTREPWEAPNKDLTTYCKHCHKTSEMLKGIIDGKLTLKKCTQNDNVIVCVKTEISVVCFEFKKCSSLDIAKIYVFHYESDLLKIVTELYN